MAGSTDLDYLLRAANPLLDQEQYVFVSLPGEYGDYADWRPIASFAESEGLTLVLARVTADEQKLSYEAVFRRITLQVHSSLSAVGLTASVAQCLAAVGISANVLAAYHHDHIFVPEADADGAISALADLAERA